MSRYPIWSVRRHGIQVAVWEHLDNNVPFWNVLPETVKTFQATKTYLKKQIFKESFDEDLHQVRQLSELLLEATKVVEKRRRHWAKAFLDGTAPLPEPDLEEDHEEG